jgi:hypothetical protein
MAATFSTSPARAVTAASIALALLAPAAARAQEKESVAEALFRKAQDRMAQSDVDAACALFAQSLAADSALGTLLNLAACHEKQGKTATAWTEFAAAQARAASADDARRATFAKLHVDGLEAKLHRVVIEIMTPAPGLRLLVDGKEVGHDAWGSPLPLDPGEHSVEVTAEGRAPFLRKLNLGPSAGTDRIEVTLAAPVVVAPVPTQVPPPAPPSNRAPWQRTTGIAAIAFGVVGLGTAAVFGVETVSKTNQRNALCAPGAPCSQQAAFDADHAARVDQQAMFVSGAIGVAAAAAGAALLVVSRGKAPAASGWKLAPVVEPGHAGLDVRGSF